MGYLEAACQLCGISFNIGRMRTADEPPQAAWSYMGGGFVDFDRDENEDECEAEDCQPRPRKSYYDGANGNKMMLEHIAGPRCEAHHGYSGYRITMDEMKECTQAQALMPKLDEWSPDPRDEDYVLRSQNAWVTGVGKGPPNEMEISNLEPPLHGVSWAILCGEGKRWGLETDPVISLPFHPACFDIFKRLSIEAFGYVNIDGLRQLWLEQGTMSPRWEGWTERPDVEYNQLEEYYAHISGSEYLVAHPLRVPGLQDLIQSCLCNDTDRRDVVFTRGGDGTSPDPFASLPPEVKLMVMLFLGPEDLASLRLASRSFKQLPQTYFHSLIRSEMPWILWDLGSLEGVMDWYALWCKLSAADGGSGTDEMERVWLWEARKLRFTLKYCPDENGSSYGRDLDRFPDLVAILDSDETAKSKMDKLRAMQKERCGNQWPKAREIKGLRNRRRIYYDVQEIIRRMKNLQSQV